MREGEGREEKVREGAEGARRGEAAGDLEIWHLRVKAFISGPSSGESAELYSRKKVCNRR